MTKFERIQQAVIDKGIKPSTMMKDLGYSHGLWYQWKNGLQNPAAKRIIEIAKYLEISPGYLLTGEYPNAEIITGNIYQVPVYNSVSAGFGAYADDNIVDYTSVVLNPNDRDKVIAAKVVGKSMFPYINDGDLVIIRKDADIMDGDIAVILIDSEDCVVKKVKITDTALTLISFNPEYEDRIFTVKECCTRIKFLGKVIRSEKIWE